MLFIHTIYQLSKPMRNTLVNSGDVVTRFKEDQYDIAYYREIGTDWQRNRVNTGAYNSRRKNRKRSSLGVGSWAYKNLGINIDMRDSNYSVACPLINSRASLGLWGEFVKHQSLSCTLKYRLSVLTYQPVWQGYAYQLACHLSQIWNDSVWSFHPVLHPGRWLTLDFGPRGGGMGAVSACGDSARLETSVGVGSYGQKKQTLLCHFVWATGVSALRQYTSYPNDAKSG